MIPTLIIVVLLFVMTVSATCFTVYLKLEGTAFFLGCLSTILLIFLGKIIF